MHYDQPRTVSGTLPRQACASSPRVSPAGPRGFGHPLASTAPQQSLTPALEKPAAAILPQPLLQRIFRYLPLSSHNQCALVCRHWHASVPATRKEVARWVAERGHHNLQVSQQ
ncbi:MAG: F-box-like domain-containing protein, partial [Kistimonas sp.]|nr:F-box-like domain-containing protein [Kistimonas sp.]